MSRCLALAATQFDVFLTADQNLEYQQNLATLPMAVVVLVITPYQRPLSER